MSITKVNLVDELCTRVGFSKKDAQILVDNFFHEITQALVDGDTVKLSGLGTFATRDKSSRPGLNPRTGKLHEVSARRVVTFKAGDKLKSQIANIL